MWCNTHLNAGITECFHQPPPPEEEGESVDDITRLSRDDANQPSPPQTVITDAQNSAMQPKKEKQKDRKEKRLTCWPQICSQILRTFHACRCGGRNLRAQGLKNCRMCLPLCQQTTAMTTHALHWKWRSCKENNFPASASSLLCARREIFFECDCCFSWWFFEFQFFKEQANFLAHKLFWWRPLLKTQHALQWHCCSWKNSKVLFLLKCLLKKRTGSVLHCWIFTLKWECFTLLNFHTEMNGLLTCMLSVVVQKSEFFYDGLSSIAGGVWGGNFWSSMPWFCMQFGAAVLFSRVLFFSMCRFLVRVSSACAF